MTVAEKVFALLETLSVRDLEAMKPAARRRFADKCRRLAELADRVDAPKSGVLAQLQDGRSD